MCPPHQNIISHLVMIKQHHMSHMHLLRSIRSAVDLEYPARNLSTTHQITGCLDGFSWQHSILICQFKDKVRIWDILWQWTLLFLNACVPGSEVSDDYQEGVTMLHGTGCKPPHNIYQSNFLEDTDMQPT